MVLPNTPTLESRKSEDPFDTAVSEFTLVTGLVRSGTSLLMKMLRSGGMDLLHDHQGIPAPGKLEGYWEWADIQKLPQNPALIDQAAQKAIKVPTHLLKHLPEDRDFKLIFVKRPIEEVVASQQAILRPNNPLPHSELEHLIQTQSRLQKTRLDWLKGADHIDLLEIDYPELVLNPSDQITRLKTFLGSRLSLPPALLLAIRPELYHHRIKKTLHLVQPFS